MAMDGPGRSRKVALMGKPSMVGVVRWWGNGTAFAFTSSNAHELYSPIFARVGGTYKLAFCRIISSSKLHNIRKPGIIKTQSFFYLLGDICHVLMILIIYVISKIQRFR